mgnify:CR=1 FL=1
MVNPTISFDIDFLDKYSDQKYAGAFEAKTKLTQREQLKKGEISRTLLGMNPRDAEYQDRAIADALAYLAIHITKAPKWWKDMDNGVECENTELIVDVYNKCSAAIEKEFEALTKKAEEARKELKDGQ